MAAHKLVVGQVEVLALTDHASDFPVPLSEVFPDVPADAWAPFRQPYPDLFSGSDTWHNHYGSYLLRSPGGTTLADTGIGCMASNHIAPRTPRSTQLERAQPAARPTGRLARAASVPRAQDG